MATLHQIETLQYLKKSHSSFLNAMKRARLIFLLVICTFLQVTHGVYYGKPIPRNFSRSYFVRVTISDDATATTLGPGVLISKRLVLSKASFADDDPTAINFIEFLGPEVLYKPVSNVILHPDYDPEAKLHDFMIVEFIGALEFNDNIQAIDLGSLHVATGFPLLILGEGLTETGVDEVLTSITVFVLEEEKCQAIFEDYDHDLMFCAEGYKRFEQGCEGDKGAPVLAGGLLVGLLDDFSDCAMAKGNHLNLFARLETYIPWIENIIAVTD